MRLLILEDDARSASYLERGLSEDGHIVDRVGDGATGLVMASEGIYDALIIDRLLPEMDGIAVTRALRQQGNDMPILIVSALATSQDKIAGLQAGADDYLGKPYAFAELTARLEAMLRRRRPSSRTAALTVGDLELDTGQRRATRQGRRIELQHREFLLLEILMRHSGQVVTRAMLLEAAWPYDFEPRGNIVDMHIHRLRQKIDSGFATPLIQTILGAGYVLKPPDPAD